MGVIYRPSVTPSQRRAADAHLAMMTGQRLARLRIAERPIASVVHEIAEQSAPCVEQAPIPDKEIKAAHKLLAIPDYINGIIRIQRIVCDYYNISRIELNSIRRTAQCVRARQVGMYLARMLTTYSLPEVGRRFGGRDHTTVLHACRKMQARYEKDEVFAAEIQLLKSQFGEAV